MSNELERFVNDNRDEFDDKNVPAGLWDKIEQQIQPKKFTRRSFSDGGKSTPVIKNGMDDDGSGCGSDSSHWFNNF